MFRGLLSIVVLVVVLSIVGGVVLDEYHETTEQLNRVDAAYQQCLANEANYRTMYEQERAKTELLSQEYNKVVNLANDLNNQVQALAAEKHRLQQAQGNPGNQVSGRGGAEASQPPMAPQVPTRTPLQQLEQWMLENTTSVVAVTCLVTGAVVGLAAVEVFRTRTAPKARNSE